jgi:PAS domain S-box-containing protein
MPLALLVDDNSDGRYVLEMYLKNNGFETLSAANGEEALKMARATPPDLIVSDILMPVMDGFTLCRQWKSDPGLGHIPFVFYSATYTQTKDMELGLSLGAVRFLIKPMETESLLRILREVLSENTGPGQGHPGQSLASEMNMLKQHNEALFRKLQKKMDDLEAANLTLQHEIKKRQSVEISLRQMEERLRTLLDTLPVGLAWADPGGRVQYANRKFGELFGYDLSDLPTFKDWFLRVCPDQDEAERLFSVWTSAIEEAGKTGGATPPLDLRASCKDAGVTDISVVGAVISNLQVAIFSDISIRTKAKEDLRRLSIAIEQAAEEVVITDPEGVIQYVNPAFEAITGYSRVEVIGQTPRLLKSGLHEPAFYEHLWNTIKTGNVWTGRITNRRKDGALIQEDAIISPLLDSFDRLSGYVSLKRDVTEMVRIESQFRQVQKMEAIGTLAGGIAHDFNNILSAILGYTDMALMDPKMDDRSKRYLRQVYGAAERATGLVKQILSFSRQSDEKPRPVKVSPIMEEALKLLRASLPSTIDIQPDIQSEPDTVLAEPTQIHQILMNLCTNAAHAMQGRKGELKVSLTTAEIDSRDTLIAHHGALPGEFLKLTVSDTGVGIAPALLNRIYDPFFTTKKPGEGTGMGLAVVYGIVKGYGGVITVESELGKGTAFHVYLPLLTAEKSEWKKDAEIRIVGGAERLLFVDDEINLVQLAKEMLSDLGYQLVGRSNSVEAWEVFRDHPHDFDLVITDMTMPNLTGIELAQQCLRVRPDIPIILCTGFSEEITPESVKKIGIRELIMKPLLKYQLASAIRRALDQKG